MWLKLGSVKNSALIESNIRCPFIRAISRTRVVKMFKYYSQRNFLTFSVRSLTKSRSKVLAEAEAMIGCHLRETFSSMNTYVRPSTMLRNWEGGPAFPAYLRNSWLFVPVVIYLLPSNALQILVEIYRVVHTWISKGLQKTPYQSGLLVLLSSMISCWRTLPHWRLILAG